MDPRQESIEALIRGRSGRPFELLGIHALGAGDAPGRVVRVFLPWAQEVELVRDGIAMKMERVRSEGLFELRLPNETDFFGYSLRSMEPGGIKRELQDPYRLPPVLSEQELKRFTKEHHFEAQRLLGARPVQHEGLAGTCFAVWAPNAEAVGVMASFNGWDARCHPMRPRGSYGVWELFVPDVGPGAVYKYQITTRLGGVRTDKADPYGYAMELRPNMASIVWDLKEYSWGDKAWMDQRAEHHSPDAPLNIYEVHLGSWRRGPEMNAQEKRHRWLSYRELAEQLVPYAVDMGYTHLELLPVTEHPYDGSWGYQTMGYFAPTARFGTPDDFRFLVDAAHRAGLGVILDWVPAHFPKDAHGLGYFDGTHLYEHADPRQGSHPDWGTLIYNYGLKQVVSFLVSNALFWLREYHIDGLRVDAVASMLYLDYSRQEGEWVANRHGGRENLEALEFLKILNREIRARFPDALVFAEESTSWPDVSRPVEEGGLGFHQKWNLGWMHDTLEYMQSDPLYRRGLQDKLTFSIYYAFTENFLLPLSHDEVVHGKRSLPDKMPGTAERQLATLRALYGYMYAHPGKKLMFMGCEFGQRREWNFEHQLDWELLADPDHRRLHDYVRQLNQVYRQQSALHEVDFDSEGFEWVDFHDSSRSVVSFLRWSKQKKSHVLFVVNFTPMTWEDYRVGVPQEGSYRLVLNSADQAFGGGDGVRVESRVKSEATPQGSQPCSIVTTLPPLGALLFTPDDPPAGQDSRQPA